MGPGREASEAPGGAISDLEEKAQQEQRELMRVLIGTLHRFFGGFSSLFAHVTDPRNPLKITYPLAGLAFAGMAMFLFRLRARRQVGLLLRNGFSIRKFHALFGVERFPHGDTLDGTFSNLEVDQIQEVVVTASKRQERLLETPQSVSVISGAAMANMGATQFRDFADTVPGLNFKTLGAGVTQVSLRGVTTGFDIGPTVAIYLDDVPYGSSSAFAWTW